MRSINDIVGAIKGHRVLVIGDVLLDHTLIGEVFPEDGRFYEHRSEYTLGGAANVALNLMAAGQTVAFVSAVGEDENGRRARSLLRAAGIDVSSVVSEKERRTPVKTRYYTENGDLIQKTDTCERREIAEETLSESDIKKQIDNAEIVVLSDYKTGCLTDRVLRTAITFAHKTGKLVLADPKDNFGEGYRGCDVLKPNAKEFKQTCGSACEEADFWNAAALFLKKNDISRLVVTRGEGGMAALSADGEQEELKAVPGDTRDVLGAGDTALAYLAAGLASGLTFKEALFLSNAAAGRKVAKYGAVPVYLWELANLPRVIKKEEIPLLRQSLYGKRVVFTNGCFDLLHAGHVYSLQQAKAQGDVLVVGVNTDESVRRLKGEDRPLIPLEDRLKMLEAVRYVDYLIPFAEDTPEEVVRALRPNVLSKGGEYSTSVVAGQDFVTERGGEMLYTKMYPEHSTTAIIASIRKK